MPGGAHLGLAGRRVVHGHGRAQAPRMGVVLHVPGRDRGQVDVFVGVEVPELGPIDVGIVGVDVGGDQAEGPRLAAARQIEEIALRGVGDLVVEIEVGRAQAGPGLPHHLHGVEPVEHLGRRVPLGRPGEVGGIDVGGQALGEAVQLVGAAEVHLAAQGRAIIQRREVVGEGRHLGGELGGVVPGADLGRQAAGHHDVAGRRAERRVAIGRVEDHALGAQAVDVGGLHQRVAVGRKELRRQLVDHDEKDVGVRACHGPRLPLHAGIGTARRSDLSIRSLIRTK